VANQDLSQWEEKSFLLGLARPRRPALSTFCKQESELLWNRILQIDAHSPVGDVITTTILIPFGSELPFGFRRSVIFKEQSELKNKLK